MHTYISLLVLFRARPVRTYLLCGYIPLIYIMLLPNAQSMCMHVRSGFARISRRSSALHRTGSSCGRFVARTMTNGDRACMRIKLLIASCSPWFSG